MTRCICCDEPIDTHTKNKRTGSREELCYDCLSASGIYGTSFGDEGEIPHVIEDDDF